MASPSEIISSACSLSLGACAAATFSAWSMIGTASLAWPVRIRAWASSHWAVAVRVDWVEEPSLAKARACREAVRAAWGSAIIAPLARSMAASNGVGATGCGAAIAVVAEAARRTVINAMTVRFIPTLQLGASLAGRA